MIGQIHFSDCRRDTTLNYVKNFETYCIFLISLTFILFWSIHRNRLLVYLECSFGSYKNFWLQLMPKIDGHDCLYCRLKRCSFRYDSSNNLILILLFFKINLFPISKSNSVVILFLAISEDLSKMIHVNSLLPNFLSTLLAKWS